MNTRAAAGRVGSQLDAPQTVRHGNDMRDEGISVGGIFVLGRCDAHMRYAHPHTRLYLCL